MPGVAGDSKERGRGFGGVDQEIPDSLQARRCGTLDQRCGSEGGSNVGHLSSVCDAADVGAEGEET